MSREEQDPWGEEESLGIPEFLFDPAGVARRRWLPVVICFVIGVMATVGVTYAWKPTYVALSTVLITSQQIPREFVKSTVQEDTLSNINAMIGKILSTQNLSNLIDARDLFQAQRETTPRIALVNEMRSNIEAYPLPSHSKRASSIVFAISYESEKPAEAADIANALAALFVESSISRRNRQAQRTTAFLRQELRRDEDELREQGRLISEFRREHRGNLPGELETNLRKLDLLTSRRESITDQVAEKQNRLLEIASTGAAVPSESRVLLEELQRQLARELAAHTDEHPNVIALRERIVRLNEVVASGGLGGENSQMNIVLASERREIARLQGTLAKIDEDVAIVNERIDATPGIAEQLTALEQKEGVLRDDYLSSLRKVEEAELAESLESAHQGGQVSVLDEASRPSSPVRPRWMIALIGFAASIALALGIAVLLELIDPVVATARHLENLSEGPILGTLPHIG
ncbi:MAG: hypothetical protein AAF430_10015 [Myxococcota bacterium]